MSERSGQPSVDQEAQKSELSRKLDAIGWGLFFLMLGAIWLFPEKWIPEDKWVMAAAIGVGVILIVMNVARYLWAVKPSVGAIVLGALALVWGVAGFYGTDLPFFPILFVLIGVGIIVSAGKRARGCGRC